MQNDQVINPWTKNGQPHLKPILGGLKVNEEYKVYRNNCAIAR